MCVVRETKVSIVIPVYNCERFLTECLSSLCSQTLREIEIICVNDGSTDQSLKVLDFFARSDRRIKILSGLNEGVSAARNKGVREASGKYIMFVDSDDVVEPDFCETPFRIAEERKIPVVSFGYDLRFPVKRKSINPGYEWSVCRGSREEKFEFIGKISVTPVTKIIETAFLRKHRLLFPDGIRIGEDQVFHWKVCLAADHLCHLPLNLYYYRSNPESATRSSFGAWGDLRYVWREIYRVALSNGPCSKREREVLLRNKLLMFRLAFLKMRSTAKSTWNSLFLPEIDMEDWRMIRIGHGVAISQRVFFLARLDGGVYSVWNWMILFGRFGRSFFARILPFRFFAFASRVFYR